MTERKLVRAVPCDAPVRLGQPSRANRYALGLIWFATASAVVGSVSLFQGPRITHCGFGGSKEDIASLAVKKYAYEAYPEWLATHRGETCPSSLFELNEYTNNKNDLDPWGSHYRMFCGINERGRPRIVVQSFGEDGVAYTADDIWSN
jgi:hypothetical protein